MSAAKLWKTCVVLLPRFASVTVADPALQSWNRLLPTPSSLYDTPINACPVPTVVFVVTVKCCGPTCGLDEAVHGALGTGALLVTAWSVKLRVSLPAASTSLLALPVGGRA